MNPIPSAICAGVRSVVTVAAVTAGAALGLVGSPPTHAAEAPLADSPSLVGRVFPESSPSKSTYLSGALQSIDFEQNQSKESASAVFKDGRVFFMHTENGNTRKADQAVEGKWIPLSAVPEEITKNWESVAGGKPLEFAMPVPIMRDHFDFTVAKQRSWTENGKKLTEFRMQPSSRLIRMMADAFHDVFDDESHMLVEYRGVTLAKMNDSGKLKDLKARITYAPTASIDATGK